MCNASQCRSNREPRAVRTLGRTFGRTLGFTLIEMLITVAIVGILTGITVPSVYAMLANQRIKMATYDFYSALAYARSQAIQRYEVVNIVPRGNDYANGWDIRASSGVLRSQLELNHVNVSAPEKVTFAYDRYGRLTTPGRYVVRLAASANASAAARCVIIDPDGRASIQVDTASQSVCRTD